MKTLYVYPVRCSLMIITCEREACLELKYFQNNTNTSLGCSSNILYLMNLKFQWNTFHCAYYQQSSHTNVSANQQSCKNGLLKFCFSKVAI